jgi:hypothetical protein
MIEQPQPAVIALSPKLSSALVGCGAQSNRAVTAGNTLGKCRITRNVQVVDPDVARHYGVDHVALDELERRILDDNEPGQWGVGRFVGISNVAERAVASDLLISLCEGAKTALLNLAMASARYTDLLGPNGRTSGPCAGSEPRTCRSDRAGAARAKLVPEDHIQQFSGLGGYRPPRRLVPDDASPCDR